MLCCSQFVVKKTVDVMLQCVLEKTVDVMLQSVCGEEDS